jgi:hypothetical protein
VLPLQHFDVVLGYDWLEEFSPMKVHWAEKWIAIPYAIGTVVLKGILSKLCPGAVVQLFHLFEQDLNLEDDGLVQSLDQLPCEVKELLDSFAEIFATKVTYPPPRQFTHTIPLIPGATPVSVRPYRYAPALKDEIERQVQEMLEAGLIQHSDSPFSSLVLLVKKNDNTYKFCADYRHLNAIGIKGSYHVPIIDEFLDELKATS